MACRAVPSFDGGPDSADHSGVQSMHDGKVLRRLEGHDSETVERKSSSSAKTIGPPLAGNLDRAFGDDDQRAGLAGAVGG